MSAPRISLSRKQPVKYNAVISLQYSSRIITRLNGSESIIIPELQMQRKPGHSKQGIMLPCSEMRKSGFKLTPPNIEPRLLISTRCCFSFIIRLAISVLFPPWHPSNHIVLEQCPEGNLNWDPWGMAQPLVNEYSRKQGHFWDSEFPSPDYF